MPIECHLLRDAPPPFEACPHCGAAPFEPFMRGQVQRRKRRFWFFGERWGYCAVICSSCHEIVGYEKPSNAQAVEALKKLQLVPDWMSVDRAIANVAKNRRRP